MNSKEQLLNQLQQDSTQIQFEQVMAVIEEHYDFTPSAFKNGGIENSAEQNQGSCKLFAFARLNELNQQQTLALFAQHYQSVIADPDGDAHQNIRQFMVNGWNGVSFKSSPLVEKV